MLVQSAIAVALSFGLGNFLCIAVNENSFLHQAVRMPKLLFCSNRCGSVKPDSRPQTYWAFDIIDSKHLVESYFVSAHLLLGVRCFTVLYFIATLITEDTTGNGLIGVHFETYFTNWTFVLFGITACLGSALTALHIRDKQYAADNPAACFPNSSSSLPNSAGIEQLQQQPDSSQQWTLLAKLHCLLVQTTAAATLFLTVFYWSLIYNPNIRLYPDNLLKHGINNLIIMADVGLSRVPFVSYHFQALLLYGSCYAIFMWSYAIATDIWVYSVLDWNKESAAVLYILLPFLVFSAFLFWYGLAVVRELFGGWYYQAQCKTADSSELELEHLTSTV